MSQTSAAIAAAIKSHWRNAAADAEAEARDRRRRFQVIEGGGESDGPATRLEQWFSEPTAHPKRLPL
jgi:hypothetical protein